MALLSEEQVQAAFDWLTENEDKIGAARGMVIRTKYRVERVEARLILQSLETSEAKRKAWARSHETYEDACEAHAAAEEVWARLQDQRDRCYVIIEAWRTIAANERGLRRIG